MEGALSEAEPAMTERGDEPDSAVGAALLMSDLEAAIATAGDEIAALRRVTDTMPRVPPAGPDFGVTEAEPAAGADDAASPPAAASAIHRTVDLGPTAKTPAVGWSSPEANVERASPIPAELPTGERRRNDGPPMPSEEPDPPAQAVAPEAEVDTDRPGANRVWPNAAEVISAASGLSPTRLAAVTPPARGVDQSWAHVPIEWPAREMTPDWTRPATAPAAESLAPAVAPLGSTDEPAWLDRPPADTSALEAVADRPAAPSAAPSLSRQGVAEPATWAGPDAGHADRATAGSAGSAGSGPSEGDVFLDGERVGRWMARHLSRELGGPAASGTAFDPRIGPSWPGSLHGN